MADNNDFEKARIESFCDLIDGEKMAQIDFDLLRQVLHDTGKMIAEFKQDREELKILKSDYQARIIGMLKAGLACRRDEEDRELATRMIDNPEQFAAAELIKIYNRTAAKFRSRFPASLKYLSYRTTGAKNQNWKEHKI